ncbi:hypothetical protein GYMLUDRAFT_563080 [Collybiopsis luxurians FD-317 M1]|uniref:Uncharacterized protein n=1 Tax=Collybiopsis luxurians FD-317 M1 TaxID=944289 RepID=A0A0D0C1W9_9AGAR|nr:hypothetical protein GYMLUDRAFT_563080 [Collybiopsis luxurians FD-317 M1]
MIALVDTPPCIVSIYPILFTIRITYTPLFAFVGLGYPVSEQGRGFDPNPHPDRDRISSLVTCLFGWMWILRVPLSNVPDFCGLAECFTSLSIRSNAT